MKHLGNYKHAHACIVEYELVGLRADGSVAREAAKEAVRALEEKKEMDSQNMPQKVPRKAEPSNPNAHF